MRAKFSLSSFGLRQRRPAAIVILMASVFGFAGTVQTAEVRHGEDEHLKPTGKGFGEHDPSGQSTRNARTSGNGIYYHGGPLMLGVPNVYYIWYGNWSGNTALSILENFASSIGGSRYFNINTTYYDGSNNHVTNAVSYAGSATDNYSHGTALSDADIQNIVASSSLPKHTNAVYFVLTSADVNETSGFCTQYCGEDPERPRYAHASAGMRDTIKGTIRRNTRPTH